MAKILILFIFFSTVFAEELPVVDSKTWVVFNIDGRIEPDLIPIIQQMQKSAGAVFGLTALEPPLNAMVLKQLALAGIDFTFTAPARLHQETKAPQPWEGGVLFISDFTRKAEVFRKWIELAQFRPSKIVVIDTVHPFSNSLNQVFSEIDVPCQTFFFVK